MLAAPYVETLRQEGFQLIGELGHQMRLSVWWNPHSDKLLQVITMALGPAVLLKGDKSYYMKTVSGEGETWARDLSLLHDYMEMHFPELRISFAHFRDVPAGLAEAEVRRRLSIEAPTQPPPTVAQLAQLQRQLRVAQNEVQSTQGLVSHLKPGPDLLSGYLRGQVRTGRAKVEDLQARITEHQQQLGLLQHLQREYQHKGSAAVYSFSISSDLQAAANDEEFSNALGAIVKELTDMHRYQVAQKLGGRLNIQVAETKEPALAWIEQWFGGALNPTQMRRLGPLLDPLRAAAEEHTMVTPDEPITVEGNVRHAPKHIAARFVSDVLTRLDKPDRANDKAALSSERLTPATLPLTLGLLVDESEGTSSPARFPMTDMVHVLISGTTGGGKSYLARVLIEEAAHYEKLNILVLDPRNQSVGLLVPEDRQTILDRYSEFGMDPRRARGFAFKYFAPALPFASPLPTDLEQLACGRTILSFKGLDDARRCTMAAGILDAVFQACAGRESESPRLLVVVDEAHLFTKKRSDEAAKQAATQTERSLDRIAREGRKFGLVLVLVTQTMKDFAYDIASVRQMTTTKIFLRNSDKEIEYAANVIGDGRLLVQLPTGTAIVHNANWGVIRVRVRPPFSKVFELGENEVRKLVGREKDLSQTLTAEARRLFQLMAEHVKRDGTLLNLTRAADLAGISSKRRLRLLIQELEAAGMIRTRKLSEQGRPRIIQLINEPHGAQPI